METAPRQAWEMTPQEIREMRKALGWTQARAGEEIGVGASAFQKYESGKSRPSKAACRLLAILHRQRLEAGAAKFLQVSHREIESLVPHQLAALLALLLEQEIRKNRLPPDCLRQRGHDNAPDGGVDAHIRWSGAPARTDVLPCREVVFQAKACPMPPSACARELTDSGGIRPCILRVLENGGAYVIFCSRQASEDMIGNREARMRSEIKSAKPGTSADALKRLHFWDSQRISDWTNRHPEAREWMRRQLCLPDSGNFTSLQRLAGEREHSGEHCPDSRAGRFAEDLLEALAEPNAVVRVTGAAGVGKTRLLLETLMGHEEFRNAAYADASAATDEVLVQVRDLCRQEQGILIVIDSCDPGRTRDFIRPLLHASSCARMIVVDDEPGARISGIGRIEVPEADGSLIEAMMRKAMPPNSRLSMERCTAAAAGSARMAQLIANDQWQRESEMVDSSACGRMLGSRDLLETARLVAAFQGAGFEGGCASELDFLAGLNQGIDADRMRADIQRLVERRLVRKANNRIALTPPPLAWMLAEEQWRIWPAARLAELGLGESLSRHETLRKGMLSQFQRLAEKQEFRPHMQGLIARLQGANALRAAGDDALFGLIFRFSPKALLRLFADIRQNASESQLAEDAQSGTTAQWLAEIACKEPQENFAPAARMLFRLAVEAISHDRECQDQMVDEFAHLLESPIDRPERLAAEKMRLLDDLLSRANTEAEEEVLVRALTAPFLDFQCARENEMLAARSRRDGGFMLRERCLRQLTELAASRQERLAGRARRALAEHARSIFQLLPFSAAADAISEIAGGRSRAYIPELIEGISQAAHCDWRGNRETADRMNQLCQRFAPKTLAEEIDWLVTRCSGHYPFLQLQNAAAKTGGGNEFRAIERAHKDQIRALALRIADNWRKCRDSLRKSMANSQKMAAEFGYQLHQAVSDRDGLVQHALATAEQMDDCEAVNPGFLLGIMRAAAERETSPDALVDGMLARIAASDRLSPHLETFLMVAGATAARLDMLADCIAGNPSREPCRAWKSGSLDRIDERQAARLVEKTLPLADQEPYRTATACAGFLHSFMHGRAVRHERLASTVHKLLRKMTPEFWRQCRNRSTFELGELAKSFAAEDNGLTPHAANETARTIAQSLMNAIDSGVQPSSGFPYQLLAERLPAVWPLLGECIVNASDERQLRLQRLFARRPSLLRGLPVETLMSWCDSNAKAQLFTASVLPVLKPDANGNPAGPDEFMHQFIMRYGDKVEICQLLRMDGNGPIHGPVERHCRKFLDPLRRLADCPELPQNFRNWAQDQLQSVEQAV